MRELPNVVSDFLRCVAHRQSIRRCTSCGGMAGQEQFVRLSLISLIRGVAGRFVAAAAAVADNNDNGTCDYGEWFVMLDVFRPVNRVRSVLSLIAMWEVADLHRQRESRLPRWQWLCLADKWRRWYYDAPNDGRPSGRPSALRKKKGLATTVASPFLVSAQDRNRTCTGFNSH
jgi:hypothetical protein